MHLRLATTRDLHRCTVISTTSLIDDATYDYLFPYRLKYPEDNFTWMQFRLQKLLYDKRAVFLVVDLDTDEVKGEGSVDNVEKTRSVSEADPASMTIAYGIWIRKGRGRDARHRMSAKNTWLNVIDASTAWIERWSTDRKYSRRDGHLGHLEATSNVSEEVERMYFSAQPNWWSLELLVTDRAFRRRGAATEIVRWGMIEAEVEDVRCGVEASEMGSKLYEALGFRKLATRRVQIPGDPDSLSYDVLDFDPRTARKLMTNTS